MATAATLQSDILATVDPDEPDERDGFIQPTTLGYAVSLEGTYRRTVADHEAAERALREEMDGDLYWPDCWLVSDHGNLHRLTLDG